MKKHKKLRDYATYQEEKIQVAELNEYNYIGVDNMLPNKGGVKKSEYVPASGYATKFRKGDILIGNIRPYLKKIWLADFDGGASNDVLVISPIDITNSEFLFACLLLDSFFDYNMSGSTGTKMPRGDKNHIMNYPIFNLNKKLEIGHLLHKINKKIYKNNQINDNLSYQSVIVA